MCGGIHELTSRRKRPVRSAAQRLGSTSVLGGELHCGMVARDEIKLGVIVGTFLVFCGTTVFLGLQSLSPQVSERDATLLRFWTCLAWALALGVFLFTRVYRQELWIRLNEAEVVFRSRFGRSVSRTRQAGVSKRINTFAAGGLALLLLMAAISAVSLPFASEMTPAERQSMDFVHDLDKLTTGPRFENVWIWIPEEDTDQAKKYQQPLNTVLSTQNLGTTRDGGRVVIAGRHRSAYIFSFDTPDPQKAIPLVVSKLKALGVPKRTFLIQYEPKEMTLRVQ